MTEEQQLSVEHRLTEVENRSKSNTHRLDDCEAAIKENSELIGAIKELAIETKYMRADLNETIERLNRLESKDGSKWDKFKWLLVAGIVTVIIGYIAIQLGLK